MTTLGLSKSDHMTFLSKSLTQLYKWIIIAELSAYYLPVNMLSTEGKAVIFVSKTFFFFLNDLFKYCNLQRNKDYVLRVRKVC